MKTQNPVRLIELLKQLLAETDKMKVGKAYIAVIEELKNVTFDVTSDHLFSDSIYKHLVQLAIKDFIHAGRSEASAKVVNEVIAFISEAPIIA